jgi:hypothetical protein
MEEPLLIGQMPAVPSYAALYRIYYRQGSVLSGSAETPKGMLLDTDSKRTSTFRIPSSFPVVGRGSIA